MTNKHIIAPTHKPMDLKKENFATMSGVKGNQFGKNVYSGVLKFKDLESFVETFSEVQRGLDSRRISNIKNYILSGLTDEEDQQVLFEETEDVRKLRFFSAITVTCNSHILYSSDTARMAIDLREAKMSINDGQHRFEGVKLALNELERKYYNSKDKEKTGKIKQQLEELQNMIIPVVIVENLSVAQEKQLFFDLNNLSKRPSRSTNIRLVQTDILAKISREISEENRYLKHLGVETEKMSIHGNNENFILLTTIYSFGKELLDHEIKQDSNMLKEGNKRYIKEVIESTLNKTFVALPDDISVKDKYILNKGYAFRAIAKFITASRTYLGLSDNEIFDVIASMDFSNESELWQKYDGRRNSKGTYTFGGSGGFKSVYNALVDQLGRQNQRVRKAKIELDGIKISTRPHLKNIMGK